MPEKLKKIPFAGWNYLTDQPSFKYVSLKYALNNSVDFVKNIINEMGESDHKWCVVDVKIVELKANQLPCLPNWHFDCTNDFFDKRRDEKHYIWQYGCGSATMFSNGFVLEPETIYSYGRETHAPSPALYPGRRILIRKTYSDIVRPAK